jgi:hypothetical protein
MRAWEPGRIPKALWPRCSAFEPHAGVSDSEKMVLVLPARLRQTETIV